ncbi:MAG: IMPACT family protein [Bacteroidetes bacterium]|nr:IMPACT family protein [Bacteroidota bacterium]
MADPNDAYLVLGSRSNAEIKEKGSRFVAFAIPVSSAEEAEAELAAIKKRDYDATHHCSAFRIGVQGSEFRYSDDGEPSSSAGLPIFRQIEGRSLTNALVVVVRYYGGTKLGTGGLVRAYGEAASIALDLAKIDEIIPRTKVEIEFAYDDTSGAMHVVQQFDTVIDETNYSEITRLKLGVRTTQVEAFESTYIEVLSGRGVVRIIY